MQDDCRDAGGRATPGAVAELEQRREHDYTDVGARVTPGAVTALPSYRENKALSKLKACAAMMRGVAPHTLRRYEQNQKKFNALCGRSVRCGGKFRLSTFSDLGHAPGFGFPK